MRDKSLMERLPIESYAAKTKDEELLEESTSGGAFTELARVVLSDSGVVCGAGWDDEFNVVHKCVESEEGLVELRGSKYVQSKLGGVHDQIKAYLSNGRKVLFTGTPCQCAVMRLKFGDVSNLIICGLMCCSNTPSNIWRKYLHEVQLKMGCAIASIKFRDKSDSWKMSRFRISFKNGMEISEPLSQNLYWKVFSSGLTATEACLNCRFRNGAHGADLIIGDFWGIEKIFPDLDVRKGISAILVYSQKGHDILNVAKLDKRTTCYKDVLLGNPYLEKVVTVDSKKRKKFQKHITRMPLQKAFVLSFYGPLYYRVLIFIYRKIRNCGSILLKSVGLR